MKEKAHAPHWLRHAFIVLLMCYPIIALAQDVILPPLKMADGVKALPMPADNHWAPSPGLKSIKEKMAFEHLVITPTAGTLWLVGEDALDRFLVQRLESKTSNRVLKAFPRSGLNPTDSLPNLMRFKFPWYRDNRSL